MKITTLAEAFAAYCRHVLIDASPATLNQFRVSLKHAQRALGKPVTLDDLTDDLVLAVIQGLPSDRRHKFHAMRRTVASFYEAAGGNATELLGHSTRDVTRTHYLDPRVVGQGVNACDVLFRP